MTERGDPPHIIIIDCNYKNNNAMFVSSLAVLMF